MHIPTPNRLLRLIAPVSAGVALTFAPYSLEHDHAGGFKVELAAAHANNGNGNGGNGNGNGGNGNGNSGNGNGNSGNGNGNSGNGNSGNGNSGNSGDGNGNSGNGSGDGDGNSSGSGNNDGKNAPSTSTSGTGTGLNLATGDKVTVTGNTIEVVHPDGITERIEAGRFKMKDALGRIIIDRAVKASDVSRLKAL